jgi:hypothetical protein
VDFDNEVPQYQEIDGRCPQLDVSDREVEYFAALSPKK